MAQAVVDSHIHFWDTDRFDYPWLQGFSELNRPFVPADLDVGEVQIEALIFVQMKINPTGSRRPLMRRASGDALGCAISSGPAAALTRGPHR